VIRDHRCIQLSVSSEELVLLTGCNNPLWNPVNSFFSYSPFPSSFSLPHVPGVVAPNANLLVLQHSRFTFVGTEDPDPQLRTNSATCSAILDLHPVLHPLQRPSQTSCFDLQASFIAHPPPEIAPLTILKDPSILTSSLLTLTPSRASRRNLSPTSHRIHLPVKDCTFT
jgi:hypothetical protein